MKSLCSTIILALCLPALHASYVETTRSDGLTVNSRDDFGLVDDGGKPHRPQGTKTVVFVLGADPAGGAFVVEYSNCGGV